MAENELVTQDETSYEEIRNSIYIIRGKQVMLDSDVARYYHYETKYINLAVRRNKERFPENFCFQLTKEEYNSLKLQIATSNKDSGQSDFLKSQIATSKVRGGKQKLPYVYTEKGIVMLSGLLRSDVAVEISVKIVEAFVEMRKFIYNNRNVFERVINLENKVDKKFTEQDKKFDIIFDQLQLGENIKQRIFFDGQIYDAYSLIVDLIKKANKEILIIDNYVDDSVLKMLSKKKANVEVVILTSYRSNMKDIDIQKFNKEYPTLKVARTNKFHDRFIVIDDNEMYHLGASIKDLGKKCFGINKIEDKEIIEKIINQLY